MYRLFTLIPILLICITLSAQDRLSRNPTVDEVAVYLRSYLVEPPSGFINYFWVDDEPLLYADLNGDGQDDLIARGWLFVAVMLWEGDHYSEPLQVIYTANPESGAWSNVGFVDWTLDGVLDIQFDRRIPIQGADYAGNRFERTIISCELICYLAWDGQLAEYIELTSEQGMYLSQANMTVSENNEGRVILDVITEDFAFNCRHSVCAVNGEVIEQDRFQAASRVGATIRTRSVWDGLEFLRTDRIILIDSHMMSPQSQLSAQHDTGQLARISFDDDACQLWLDEVALGESFDCVVNFIQVYWHQDYLILEYAYFNQEHLIIYDQSGEIRLQVSGAIRDLGLFGVRLQDGQVLSAGERYTANCAYQQCWFALNDALVSYEIFLWESDFAVQMA